MVAVQFLLAVVVEQPELAVIAILELAKMVEGLECNFEPIEVFYKQEQIEYLVAAIIKVCIVEHLVAD